MGNKQKSNQENKNHQPEYITVVADATLLHALEIFMLTS